MLINCAYTSGGHMHTLVSPNHWFQFILVRNKLELGLKFGTGTEFYFSRTVPETGFLVLLICGTGTRTKIHVFQKIKVTRTGINWRFTSSPFWVYKNQIFGTGSDF
jgi:hypothetical protein